MRILLSMTAASSLLVLAACGGGGGGGDSGPVPSDGSGSGSSPITSSNYVGVGADVLRSSWGLPFVASTANVVSASVSSIRSADVAQALGMPANPQLAKIINQFARPDDRLQAAAVAQQTFNCIDGGSNTQSLNDPGNNGPDAGDSVTVQFSSCRFGTTLLNGQQTTQINQLTASSADVYTLGLTMAFSNLSISSGSSSLRVNGSFTATEKSTAANAWSLAVSAPSLVIDGSVNGASYSTGMSNFNVRRDVTPAAPGLRVSTTFDGTFTSSSMAAQSSVSVQTVSPFVQYNGTYPSSGQALITSAAGGRLRVTAQNSTTVLFEVDADSNGVYESQQTGQWSELF